VGDEPRAEGAFMLLLLYLLLLLLPVLVTTAAAATATGLATLTRVGDGDRVMAEGDRRPVAILLLLPLSLACSEASARKEGSSANSWSVE